MRASTEWQQLKGRCDAWEPTEVKHPATREHTSGKDDDSSTRTNWPGR
jgi:hypothetical protein